MILLLMVGRINLIRRINFTVMNLLTDVEDILLMSGGFLFSSGILYKLK